MDGGDTEATTESELEVEDDIPTVTNSIRKHINKWAKDYNKGELAGLKENHHYHIVVTCNTSETTPKCSASIRCICGKAFVAHRKPTGSRPWQISNWTKHYKKHKCGFHTTKQATLSPFLSSPSPVPTSESDPDVIASSLSPYLEPIDQFGALATCTCTSAMSIVTTSYSVP